MKGTQTFGGGWSPQKNATITDYFTGGGVRYKENDDLVIVDIQDVSLNKNVGGSSVTFATGLPIIPIGTTFVITDWQGKRFLRISYNTTGELKIHYPNTTEPSSVQFYGQAIAFKR